MNNKPASPHGTPASWDDLRIFAQVVQSGSLSKAAEHLKMSQPTISRHIRSLEQSLGGPILQRNATGCQATARGKALQPLIEQMSLAASHIQRIAHFRSSHLSGVVRIACGELIGRSIARKTPLLIAGAPDIHIEILAGMKDVNLERGDAHIALRNRRPETGNLYCRRLGETPFAVYASVSFAETYPEAWTEERYQRCRWAAFVPTLDHLPSMRWLLPRLKKNPPVLRLSTSMLILETIASGAALGLLPLFVGDDDTRLVRLTDPLQELSLDAWMLIHQDARDLETVRLIADRLAETLYA
ncbi:MAG: LysR family transcriptional regulator [Myxococcales bacterium]|nr:LysR family transcriptional regulator [Myxococcales bacterium]MCB9641556.1 LysR family transcriptional regulator [Myxococcales bacterium]